MRKYKLHLKRNGGIKYMVTILAEDREMAVQIAYEIILKEHKNMKVEDVIISEKYDKMK